MQMLRTSSDSLASVWRFLTMFFSRVPFPNWDDAQQLTKISGRVLAENKQPIDRLLIGRLLCHGWIWTDLFFYCKMFGWHELFFLLKQTIHRMKTNFTQSSKVLGPANFCQGSIDQNFHQIFEIPIAYYRKESVPELLFLFLSSMLDHDRGW